MDAARHRRVHHDVHADQFERSARQRDHGLIRGGFRLANANADTYRYPDSNSDCNANSNANSDRNAKSKSDRNANSNTYTHRNTNTDTERQRAELRVALARRDDSDATERSGRRATTRRHRPDLRLPAHDRSSGDGRLRLPGQRDT